MVAVEGSPAAIAALHAAIDVARAQNQSLVIANVVERGRTGWAAAEPIFIKKMHRAIVGRT